MEMPWGTWNRAPMGRLIPWTMVTEELLKAMPASRAARAIWFLPSQSSPCSHTFFKWLKILWQADRARVSLRGWAFFEVYASMAWVRASTPVAAVISGGAVMVNCGSMTAKSGISPGPFKSIFTCVAVSVIMVNWVASDPVPAVVGMAAMGAGFSQTDRPM